MQPIMLFLDVDKHESVSVFSEALVHFLPHQRPPPLPSMPLITALLPKAKCVHIYTVRGNCNSHLLIDVDLKPELFLI